MTQEEEKFEYVTVDPRLAKAADRGGRSGFVGLMLDMAGVQKLDPETQKGIFWQTVGFFSSEAGRSMARPWQYLSIILLVSLFLCIAWIWNFMFLLTLQSLLGQAGSVLTIPWGLI